MLCFLKSASGKNIFWFKYNYILDKLLVAIERKFITSVRAKNVNKQTLLKNNIFK